MNLIHMTLDLEITNKTSEIRFEKNATSDSLVRVENPVVGLVWRLFPYRVLQ